MACVTVTSAELFSLSVTVILAVRSAVELAVTLTDTLSPSTVAVAHSWLDCTVTSLSLCTVNVLVDADFGNDNDVGSTLSLPVELACRM